MNIANALSEAKGYFKKRQYEQTLAVCDRILKADPKAYGAYTLRWNALSETLAYSTRSES